MSELVQNFFEGVLFGTIFDFFGELVGKTRIVILSIIAVSIALLSYLYASDWKSMASFVDPTWNGLAFFIGLFPGNWLGSFLGRQFKSSFGSQYKEKNKEHEGTYSYG